MSVSRHTTYNLLGGIAPTAVSLLTVPLFLHVIGGERYGVLALAWLLFGYFTFFDLGFGRAATQRIAAMRHATARERATTFWTALAINLGSSLLGAILLYVVGLLALAGSVKASAPIRSELIAALPALAVTLPITMAAGVVSGALKGRERFLEINAIAGMAAVLSQLLPLAIAYLVGPRLPGLILATAAANLISLAALGWFAHARVTEGHGPVISRSEAARLLSFGGWMTVTAIVGPLMIILDRFVIGAWLGALAVTIYTVPWQLLQRLLLLPTALHSALVPKQAAASDAELRSLTDQGLRAVTAVMTPVAAAAIFLIEPFLRLWLGSKLDVEAAAQVGRVLILGFWANGIAFVPFGQIEARGRVRVAALVHTAELPIYLAVLALLLETVGIAGAAIAFTLRCAVDALIFLWLATRQHAPWLNLFGAAVLLAIAFALAELLDPISVGWLLAAAVVAILAIVHSYLVAPALIRRTIFRRAS